MTQQPSYQPEKTARTTVTVVLVLVGIFCGLPLLGCLGMLVIGGLGNVLRH